MNDSATIYQCEDCLRYFEKSECRMQNAEFILMVPQPVLHGLPEVCVCGLADCAGIEAAIVAEEEARARAERRRGAVCRQALSARWQERHAPKAQGKRARRGGTVAALGGAARLLAHEAGELARGCPPEREVRPVETLAHREQVRAFAGSANAAAQNETMLRILCESFDVEQAERPGNWVSNAVLEAAGIGRPNSRASDLRGSRLVAGHAFVVGHGLDVDCTRIENGSGNGKEYYAYRICRRVDSERLKRKVAADEAQPELSEPNRRAQ